MKDINSKISGDWFEIKDNLSKYYDLYDFFKADHLNDNSFEESPENSVIDNIIVDNYNGIAVEYYSHQNTITGNIITGQSVDGLSLWRSSYTIVSGNNISGNNFDGITTVHYLIW